MRCNSSVLCISFHRRFCLCVWGRARESLCVCMRDRDRVIERHGCLELIFTSMESFQNSHHNTRQNRESVATKGISCLTLLSFLCSVYLRTDLCQVYFHCAFLKIVLQTNGQMHQTSCSGVLKASLTASFKMSRVKITLKMARSCFSNILS